MTYVRVVHYWLNRYLCWHSRHFRAILVMKNGTVVFCAKCGRKRLGIYEFEYELENRL